MPGPRSSPPVTAVDADTDDTRLNPRARQPLNDLTTAEASNTGPDHPLAEAPAQDADVEVLPDGASHANDSPERFWRISGTDEELRAEFTELQMGVVSLRAADSGHIERVPVAKLSAQDLD